MQVKFSFCRLSANLCLLIWLVSLSACAGTERSGVALALNGPDLAVAGDYKGRMLEGEMKRSSMAGYGYIRLRSLDKEEALVCESKVDIQPNEKGRIKAALDCGKNGIFLFSYRNLGPDQGFGVGKISGEAGLLVFFYHPSLEEAHRRLPEIKADLATALAEQK